MVLIKFSAFFTALIHCVMAYFQDQPVPYQAVSPIPDKEILQTPPYDKIPEQPTPAYIVKPSWFNKPEVSGLVGNDKVEDQSLSKEYKPKEPVSPFKGIGYTYPQRAPRVKLGLVGLNGMLPVKKTEDTPVHKPEPNSKAKPAQLNISSKDNIKDTLIGRVELRKDIDYASLFGKLIKPELKLDLPRANVGPHGHGRVEEALFKPEHNPLQLGLVLNPNIIAYPFLGIYYGNNQDTGAFPLTSTNNPVLPRTDALKTTNFEFTTNPVYGQDIDITIPFRAHEPVVLNAQLSKEVHNLAHKTQQYQYTLPVGILKPDYSHPPTPGSKDDLKVDQLPPVPTTMSLLQRTQLALLNTVAGLPGGVPQALDALRPR